MDVTPGRIARAFPVHPLPHPLFYRGDDVLYEVDHFDILVALTSNSWPRRDFDEIYSMVSKDDRLPKLRLIPWPEVEEERLNPLFDVWPLLSPAAQHYYLPTFLSLALNATSGATSLHIANGITGALSRGALSDMAVLMTLDQWAVVRHCVRRLRHRFPLLFDEVDLARLRPDPPP